MEKDLKSKTGGTLRIKRPSKIRMDDRGHAVWAGEIDTAEFELVPTSHVKALIASGDADKINEISAIAREGKQGVLIKDCNDGRFSVLKSDNFDKLLQEPDAPVVRESDEEAPAGSEANSGDELELMDTQILRKVLVTESKVDKLDPEESEGFNPYDTAK